jgi:hypothetical protein
MALRHGELPGHSIPDVRFPAVLAAGFFCVAIAACSSGPSRSSEVPATVHLNFRPVYCVAPNYVAPHSASGVATSGSATTDASPPPTAAPVAGVSQADCANVNLASIPSTALTADDPAATVLIPLYDRSARYILGPADLSGDVVSTASVVTSEGGDGSQVQITFTASGADQFDEVASERYPYYEANVSNPPVESQEAIELNAVVLSAPVIQAREFNGTVILSGSASEPFTQAQAEGFAKEIRSASVVAG